MGRLIALDTSILIYLLEEHPTHAIKVHRLFERIEKGSFRGVFSIIGMIELLTGVKKKGRDDLAQDYKLLLSHFPHFEIYSIDEDIVDIASKLRAVYGIRTPDAIHLATAITKKCTIFISNDRALKKVKEIKVVSVNELEI
ncbi:type II toxin-antitoxin system VapC family toxin [Candidatus Uhrbacteria bacterium]|nr:type II toxin-antitoxin system VapC family toxin [Candidatus Uhrbacteria bacterium]